MDEIVDGMAVGTLPATAHGIVIKSDHPQNGWDTLEFRSYQSYLDAGSLPVLCVTDPTKCSNGITVSFVVRFEDATKQWARKTFIVDTIGDETFQQGNRGFAVYVVNGRLHVKVLTRKREWTVDHTLITGALAWQHVMFTWQVEKGLQLYLNGSLRYLCIIVPVNRGFLRFTFIPWRFPRKTKVITVQFSTLDSFKLTISELIEMRS